MVAVHSRGGTFSPSPAQQQQQQGNSISSSHSPHPSSAAGIAAAGLSPSTNSPTGGSSLTKIVVAQVYLLLSTIKEDKDRTKWESQAEQLRKLIDEHGMEVFQKYFSRLVVGNAGTIFPSLNRPVANPGNYQILVNEMRKIAHDVHQASKIAESIETASEDIFRDFDLATFLEHFKLDPLEKTILALAFRSGPRQDLKNKADAILSANYPSFLHILSRPNEFDNHDLTPEFLATLVDRFIQESPSNFTDQAKLDLNTCLAVRFAQARQDGLPPPEVLAAFYLTKLRAMDNPLIAYLRRTGPAFTADEETCRKHLQRSGTLNLSEEDISAAILYATISRSPQFSVGVLVASLRKELPADFKWQEVITHFDQPDLRISRQQFFAIYQALLPIAIESKGALDLQALWGGHWRHSETQLSFLNAYASLSIDLFDASTIPGLKPSFTAEEYAGTGPEIEAAALRASKHTLVSAAAITAIFNVALQSAAASDSPEAKRLFQEAVVPNLDVFLVSAFSIPKPWPDLAIDTVKSLFDRFLWKMESNWNFVLHSLWRKDRGWVALRLVEAHANRPLELPIILEHAVRHGWLDELVVLNNGFSLDLAALAHAKGHLDLERWQRMVGARNDLTPLLLTFLGIKAQHELDFQRNGVSQPQSISLPVKTIWALLHILDSKNPTQELTMVQRTCIIAYPRLINYGEGFDDIIDANGAEGNKLPDAANAKMEEHYKRMYSDDLEVRNVVEALDQYKHSRDSLDQDVFACMIHGLFDEYALYNTYPLEALATTAVLFGGIICHKLISDIPLEIGLGMILDAVKDFTPDESMYKFGLQALMQLFPRLREWPGFCQRLLQIPGLRGTEAWKKAEEVVRDNEHQMAQNGMSSRELTNGSGVPNGAGDDIHVSESTSQPFASIHVESSPFANFSEDPSAETQEKVLFVLNNITERNLETKLLELKEVIEDKHRQWFGRHLVEERAKMQPNYHQLYLDLVRQFENKALWSEVLRETYVSVIRLLNAESTMQSSTERTHLKNLGGWLGSLTLARDKPIKHKNIAFKQLLIEAFDTQRLLVVIPFVCKVLIQGASSTVFKPPNPWLMDIIHLLIELYHHAELKLNLKFEIEVLCKGLNLDHKSIEPSTDIQTRSPRIEEPLETAAPAEIMERFENMSLTGMTAGVGSGRFSPSEIITSIPDLGPHITYPPVNDMINQSRLQEILRTAITRAVHEIIAPVVERSVTIAAISTAQMIHKDFATEPDENRVRQSAINMVKRTAGALALVTSKEPLRASMNNYIRAMSQDMPQGLPEGTIIMCVNANLDMACSMVEKKAEERAIPEIEEMIEPELEARRRHRMNRPNEPYLDPSLSRWAFTIPHPYKLLPNTPGGLNPEQMAIYEEFARQPRPPSIAPSHGPSASDAGRNLPNDVLGDTFASVPGLNIPTPAETPATLHQQLGNQQMYAQPAPGLANGRPGAPVDMRAVGERVHEHVLELVRTAESSPEQHYIDLPHAHNVLNLVDAIITLVIRSTQLSDEVSRYAANIICDLLFSNGVSNTLAVESLVHVLDNLCKFPGRTVRQVVMHIAHSPDEAFLNVPLVVALVRSDMGLLEWQRVDLATSKALYQHKEGSIEFLASLLDQVLLGDRPIALRADFARSLEALTMWMTEDGNLEAGRILNQKLRASGIPGAVAVTPDSKQEQMEYIFDEWVHLFNNGNATDKSIAAFILQLHGKQIMTDSDEVCSFLRICVDTAVDRFEHNMQNDANPSIAEAYLVTDALGRLIGRLVKHQGEKENEVKKDKAAYLMSMLALLVLIMNNHHVSRGERFNQRVFFRLFSVIMTEVASFIDLISPEERKQIMLGFIDMLHMIQPMYFPGFIFGWIAFLSHKDFLTNVMRIPDQGAWEPFANLVELLLLYLGDLLKPLHLTPVTKDIYRGAYKFIVVLQHDYPEFLSANHLRLCAAIPGHCIQLRNMILMANPLPYSKFPDPAQPGLKIDRMEEIRDAPIVSNDVEVPLRQAGLLDIVDQMLNTGPSEDAIAHIAHAIQRKGSGVGAGFLPVNTDVALVDALVVYVGIHSIAKASQKHGPTFVSASPDAALLTMLARELSPEARYYFLNSIVNQLRFPNSHTHYFSQALLEIFGHEGLNDPEEAEVQQQITRILLERLIGQWPQPWGLLVTVIELVKNDSYKFFDLPFIKSSPEVAERFIALARPPL